MCNVNAMLTGRPSAMAPRTAPSDADAGSG